MQPRTEDYEYSLDEALATVVAIRTQVPEDAFTAGTLGTERLGNGVLIRPDGLILTIGYLVTEAETIWITLHDGRTLPGHLLGYDQETGFGLVQALARAEFPALSLGRSKACRVGDRVVIGGAGGRKGAVAAGIVAKQEFAGYWEYVLDEALFTAPSHPHWGGTALIGAKGELLGIGSLQLQHAGDGGRAENINMIVPIDLLAPIMSDLERLGRVDKPPRPWLGLYAAEARGKVVVAGLAAKGPAQKADLRTGDVIQLLAGREVRTLSEFFRGIWQLGQAGVAVPLIVERKGAIVEMRIKSADRAALMKRPILH